MDVTVEEAVEVWAVAEASAVEVWAVAAASALFEGVEVSAVVVIVVEVVAVVE